MGFPLSHLLKDLVRMACVSCRSAHAKKQQNKIANYCSSKSKFAGKGKYVVDTWYTGMIMVRVTHTSS